MELAETLAQSKNIKIDIGNLANTGLEFGLRTILPDFIEDDIIEIKDTFIEEGFIDGIQNIIDKAEDITLIGEAENGLLGVELAKQLSPDIIFILTSCL